MASRKGEDRPDRENAAKALVYVPCPACGRAVQLSAENRVPGEGDAYECPNCGARLVLAEN